MQLVHPEADREGALEDTRIRQIHMLDLGLRRASYFLVQPSRHAWGKVYAQLPGEEISEGVLC